MEPFTGLTEFGIVFLVLAVLASVAALSAVGAFVVQNRRVRLARHQSIRTYYRGLALTH